MALLAIVPSTADARALSDKVSPKPRLSEHFFFEEVEGGRRKPPRRDLFVRTPEGKDEYIGTIPSKGAVDAAMVPLVGFMGEAAVRQPEGNDFAVSKGGQSIVYVHHPELAPPKVGLEGGIYRYRIGTGATLLHRLDQLGSSLMRLPKPIPSNVLVFNFKVQIDWEMIQWGVTAEGDEFPLILLESTPIHKAAYEGDTARIDALASAGAEVNARGYWDFTPLDLAVLRAHPDAVARLVARGASQSGSVLPPIHLASRLGQEEAVKAMLEAGVSANLRDQRGRSPLHAANSGATDDRADLFGVCGHEKGKLGSLSGVVAALLQHGADPNLIDAEGRSPLHHLAERQRGPEEVERQVVEAARLLFEHGARPDVRDAEGNSPLHTFAGLQVDERPWSGQLIEWEQSAVRGMLELLIGKTPDINAKNAKGLSPLELAIESKRLLTARLLVARGADDTVKDSKGRTAGQSLQDLSESEMWRRFRQ